MIISEIIIETIIQIFNHVYAELAGANARCETLSKMVTQYQDELIPGYRERAEKAERERDDAVEQLHHCENSCDYCTSRRECDKESCFGPSPKTGEPIDYWSWDKNA